MTEAGLSYTDAAEIVLTRHSRGAPMHYRRITEVAIEEALIHPGGKTPEASMNASITQDIKRRERTGAEQRFRAHGRGMYGLALPADPLGGAIDRKNNEVKKRLRALLGDMEPRVFEQLIGELLAALGFEDVEVTKYSGDGGIDVRAVLAVGGVTDIQTAIQVKRWSNNVSGRVVRELRGALGPHEQGLIITLSRFTPDALNEAAAPNRAPIALVNGDRLLDLLMESEIGVTRRRLTIYELDEGLFTDSASEEAEPTKPEGGAITFRRSKGGKPLSVWPLPGGRLVWRTSLDQMLSYVAEQAPTMEEAIGWLISSFDRASSEKVARGYWQVPRTFGLLETQGEHLTLTATGAEYLANSNPQALLDILRANVAGFDELVDYLAERPHRVDELLERLRHDLGVTWETEAQVNFRLGWLENVGAAEADGAYWRQRNRPLVSPD